MGGLRMGGLPLAGGLSAGGLWVALLYTRAFQLPQPSVYSRATPCGWPASCGWPTGGLPLAGWPTGGCLLRMAYGCLPLAGWPTSGLWLACGWLAGGHNMSAY